MNAVVYDRPREFAVRDVPDLAPKAGEVLIRPVVTGVCGTDVHLHAGEFFPTYPLIPGHEIVGLVEQLGDGVDGVAAGQLVAVDNLIVCGECRSCREGRPHFCKHLKALGVTDPGGFAELVVAPAFKCYDVGDLDLETAVLAEPTACAVHGLDVLDVKPGADVLLFGAGPSGMILMQLLATGGAARMTVAAPTAFKLELARGLGADRTVQIERDEPEQTIATLREVAPEGFDVVVDATGSTTALETAIPLTRDGGTVFLYGMAAEAAFAAVHPYEIFRRELVIKGSFAQAHSFDRAIRALRTGRVKSQGIVTHRFSLSDYGSALSATASDSNCVKAIVEHG